jgi:hypothetical protein
MAKIDFKSVDEYIASQPEPVQGAPRARALALTAFQNSDRMVPVHL